LLLLLLLLLRCHPERSEGPLPPPKSPALPHRHFNPYSILPGF
jgi:hypothetical protein